MDILQLKNTRLYSTREARVAHNPHQNLEYCGVNVTVVHPLCREPEQTAIAKTVVRGYRQRFKPNVTRACGRKEEPEKEAGNDKISHLQLKGETEKVFNKLV